MDTNYHEVPGLAKSKSISQLHFNAINNAASSKHKHTAGNSSGDETRKLLPNQTKFVLSPASQNSNSPPTTTSGSSGSTSSSSATSPQPPAIGQNSRERNGSRSNSDSGSSPVALDSIRPQRPSKTAGRTKGMFTQEFVWNFKFIITNTC